MIFATDKHGRGLRGLLIYGSLFNARARGDKRFAMSSQRCYRFKTIGESARVWESLIRDAAQELNCAHVWAFPPHDPDKTNPLQDIFGTSIRRAFTVEKRKYNHRTPYPTGSLELPPAPEGRVLIVDDICTTGASLLAVRDLATAKGIECEALAAGLNWRLAAPGVDAAALDAQWEAAAGAVRGDPNTRRRERRAGANAIECRPIADPARRARLESDPAKWLRFYMAAAFPLEFGQVHIDIIGAARRAIEHGQSMAAAAPRGCGKTTVLQGVALWAVLSGRCRFPTVAGWSHGAARRLLRAWLRALSDNENLADDYPEFTCPFEASTHSNRLRNMTWAETGLPVGADVRTTDGCLVLPSGRGALGAVSVSGSARGLSVATADGQTVRPDVLLLDDPQDARTAASARLSKETAERIEGDLFSMAGPTSRLATLAAVTIIHEGDVAELLLNRPDFEAIRVPQITAWPEGWDAESSPVRALWDSWNKARIEGLGRRDGGKAARKFYRANKTEMTKGMTVSWGARFDKARRDPDAMFAALWDFFHLGERAFSAERQNAPMRSVDAAVFELPPAHVAARVNGLARRVAPENAVALVGMVDINADGLRWAIAAASNERALSVVDYGVYPGAGRLLIDKAESDAVSLMRGLAGLDAALAGLVVTKGETPLPLDCMMLDCGGTWMQTVFDWLAAIRRTSRLPWLASRGWGSRSYRPNNRNTIGRPGDGFHLAEWPGKGRVLVHNSDAWRHRQQKGWLLPTGAPDSIALFGGERERHEVFAAGVTAEKLIAYAETDAGPLYRWQITPGERNDWGDVATGLYVAAARAGLSPTGITRPLHPARKKYSQADLQRR